MEGKNETKLLRLNEVKENDCYLLSVHAKAALRCKEVKAASKNGNVQTSISKRPMSINLGVGLYPNAGNTRKTTRKSTWDKS